jgi:hypothetical protein
VLQLLQRLGVKVGLELPPADASAFQLELSKVRTRRAASSKGGSNA